MQSKWFFLLLLGLLFSLNGNAAIPRLPPTISPERQNALPQTPLENIKPEATIQVPGGPTPELDESAKTIKFKFNSLTLEGNTVYDLKTFEPLYGSLLHREITLYDLAALAKQIEQYYVAHGYILTRVFIPPQEIDEAGNIKLTVIEGYIDQYFIDGDASVVKDIIRMYLKPVLESRPLKLSVLERAILLIEDLAGVSTRAVLTPSVEKQGATSLIVLLNRDMFEGSVTADNRGTVYLGPTEFSTTLAFNNVLQHPSRTWADAKVTSAVRELDAYDINHQANVYQNGATVTGSFAQNFVKPGADLAPLHIEGVSTTAAAVYMYPVIRSRRMNLNVTLDYDYLDSTTDIFSQLFTHDKIESLRAGANFNVFDGWNGFNLITTQLSQGLQLFSGNDEPAILRSRVDGSKVYTTLDASYTRTQYFSNPFSLFVSLNGQYAFDALLSAEQIGYGGAQYGSAYDPSEIVGDSGFEGKVEARYDSPKVNKLFRSVQYYTSYDWGVLWNKSDYDGLGKQSGTSLAGGLRLAIGPKVTGSLELAKPLTRKVAAADNKDARVFFAINVDLGELMIAPVQQ